MTSPTMTMGGSSLPNDGLLAMLDEIVVGECEVMVAKEASVGTQGRRVGRAQYQMLLRIDECRFLAGRSSPEYEYESFPLAAQRADDGVGERLPSASLMRTRPMRRHGQRRVEKKDTLISPREQVGDSRSRRRRRK